MFPWGRREKTERAGFLGPVFGYDLVRTSRRGQVIGHRLVYACVLLGVLFLVYWNHFPIFSLADLFRSPVMNPSQRTQFAESFFMGFMIAQFAVIILLVPLYTAGAVAEEKERRTIDLLFTTELSD